MQKLLANVVVVIALAVIANSAHAAVSISGTLPTMLANGDTYKPAAGDTVNISRNGTAATAYTVTAAQASSGSFSFADASGASACTKDTWTASYTSSASSLTSAATAGVSTAIDGTNCAVKFVPGLQIK